MKKLRCMLFHLILVLFHDVVADNARVYDITPCAYTYYPVTVNNVDAIERNGNIFVSGSLSTDNELTPPITASLTVKRYVNWVKLWVPFPCVDGVGSCTYDNLCSYGVLQNKSCPENFVKNNVPCRCPILEGTYVMPSKEEMYLFPVPKIIHQLDSRLETLETGTYWIEVKITRLKELLSCYQLYVDYDDGAADFELNEVIPSLHIP